MADAKQDTKKPAKATGVPFKLSDKVSLDAIDVKDKRVLVRVDFNVPLHKRTGKVTDANRIVEALPTVRYLLEKGARSVVLMSHLGRPDGHKNPKFSLEPVSKVVEKHLGHPVTFLHDCVGPEVEAACANPAPGTVFLLENLRFYPEEEGSSVTEGKKVKASKEDVAKFRKSLSKLGDIYVNDAFGTAHRAHSSMVGVQLPVRAAGFLIKKELQAFSTALEGPPRPFLAILGGAKIGDKIKLITNLLDRVDEMIIGGGMAFTFTKVMLGIPIGNSLFDKDGAGMVESILAKAKAKGVKLHFPVDWLTGDKFAKDAKVGMADDKTGIPDGLLGMDCGPATCIENAKVIWRAKTIIFNGPQGVFEFPVFGYGTRSALQAVAAATHFNNALTIIGGGDTAAAAARFFVSDMVSHVSTGGGASLELLEGHELPGIVSLSDKAGVGKNKAGGGSSSAPKSKL